MRAASFSDSEPARGAAILRRADSLDPETDMITREFTDSQSCCALAQRSMVSAPRATASSVLLALPVCCLRRFGVGCGENPLAPGLHIWEGNPDAARE